MLFKGFPEVGTNDFLAFVAYLNVAEACSAVAMTLNSASV